MRSKFGRMKKHRLRWWIW